MIISTLIKKKYYSFLFENICALRIDNFQTLHISIKLINAAIVSNKLLTQIIYENNDCFPLLPKDQI